MEEERLAILRMLSEGKISPEEAATLLDALGTKPEAGKAKTGHGAGAESFADGVAGFASRVAAWGAELGAKVAEEIRDGRVPIIRWFGECFDGHETVTERTGQFDGEEAEIDCSCDAGSFGLKAWDEPGYRLTVRQRFGRTEEPIVETSPGRLSVEGKGILRGDLLLPRGVRYRLRLRSSVGRLEVDGLTIGDGTIATDAGSTNLGHLTAESLTVKSAAGSIEGIEIAAKSLRVENDCGRIHLELNPAGSGLARLETKVGAVSLVVPARQPLGYRLWAEAGVGSIWCSPHFIVTDDDRTIGRRRLTAETSGFAEQEHQVELKVRTDCGSIRVSGCP